MKKNIKLIGTYLYSHLLAIIAVAVLYIIMFLMLWAYAVPLEPLLYGYALSALILALIIPFHFYRYYKRHKQCRYLLHNAELQTEPLTIEGSLVEQDYREIINQMWQLNREATTNFEKARQESIDYYTTWVHQIKTPISVMKMVLQSNDTDENRELLSQLFRIEQYVEMVLCYFRLNGPNDFVLKLQPLDPIIKLAIRHYAPQFIRKKLSLHYTPTEALILTDQKWLLFIIEQLIDNAIKYTESGGITITVGSNNILEIKDTGIGIAAEDLPRIFEKGFTGYNGRTDKKSTGLGLYLCHRAAKKLSHKLTVISYPGKGSTFFIDFNTYNLKAE